MNLCCAGMKLDMGRDLWDLIQGKSNTIVIADRLITFAHCPQLLLLLLLCLWYPT